jgi:hypothetical protein
LKRWQKIRRSNRGTEIAHKSRTGPPLDWIGIPNIDFQNFYDDSPRIPSGIQPRAVRERHCEFQY